MTKTHTLTIAFTMMSALTLAGSLASAQSRQEKQSSESSKDDARTIRGVWRTEVTGRDCQTDAPLPGPPLAGLFTFNGGGTMAEYGIPPNGSPARRSPGHGVWQREHGWQDYSFAFTYYRYDANGVFVGSQKVTAALELFAGGDDFESKSVIEILDASNNVTLTICGKAVGKRFE